MRIPFATTCLTLLAACVATDVTSSQSSPLHPASDGPPLSDPSILGFWNTDTAAGAYTQDGTYRTYAVTMFSATTGAADELGLVYRLQANPPSAIQWATAWPGFQGPGHLPHVAWLGHTAGGTQQDNPQYDGTFVAVFTMSAQHTDDTLAYNVSVTGGSSWNGVQTISFAGAGSNPDHYISHIQIATEPEGGPATLGADRHFYILQVISSHSYGEAQAYDIWRFHLDPQTHLAVNDGHLPPINLTGFNPNRLNLVLNQAQDGTPYVAIAASDQPSFLSNPCPNSTWLHPIHWQFAWFNFNSSTWRTSNGSDSDQLSGNCAASGPAAGTMQNDSTPAMSRDNDGSIIFGYAKKTTALGLRVNIFQTQPVLNTTLTDHGNQNGWGCTCNGQNYDGSCNSWSISSLCASVAGICTTTGTCQSPDSFPLNWPQDGNGHVWIEPQGTVVKDSILPTMPRDYFLHAVTWLDNRDDPTQQGTFGSVYGTDTSLPGVDTFVAPTRQVAFSAMNPTVHSQASYMSINTWYLTTFFWGASFGGNKLFLQYDAE